jgi:microcystin-dependent protein
LSEYVVGESGGQPAHTLLLSELPAHSHALNALPVASVNNTPAAGSSLSEGHGGSRGSGFQVRTYTTIARGTTLNPAAVGNTGNSLPHENMQPYLVVNWCIAWQGVFPSRP